MFVRIRYPLKYTLLTLWLGTMICMLTASKSVDLQGVIVVQNRTVELSFNRYQAGYVCRERGWEFCFSWSYSISRLA